MRNGIVRSIGGAVLACWSAIGEADACTNAPASVVVGQAAVTMSVFVPTIVSATVPVSIVAPVATHVSGFGVVAVPQAVVVPQATVVQPFLVPQFLQQQVVRQRIRTTVVPRFGVRSLLCR